MRLVVVVPPAQRQVVRRKELPPPDGFDVAVAKADIELRSMPAVTGWEGILSPGHSCIVAIRVQVSASGRLPRTWKVIKAAQNVLRRI